MIGIDWTNYVYRPAPRSLLCVFRHPAWDRTVVCYARNFFPDCNVVGLEWKLTGIARMELDQMPEEAQAQVMALVPGSCMLVNSGAMLGYLSLLAQAHPAESGLGSLAQAHPAESGLGSLAQAHPAESGLGSLAQAHPAESGLGSLVQSVSAAFGLGHNAGVLG
jgi:hypothetical protein